MRNAYHARKTQKRQRQRQLYHAKQNPRVPAEPFIEWLRKRVDQLGSQAAVAQSTGIRQDRLHQILRGYYWTKGKRYPFVNMLAETIDRALQQDGTTTFFNLYGRQPPVTRSGQPVTGARCKIRGCNRVATYKGMCSKHYSRWRDRQRQEAA